MASYTGNLNLKKPALDDDALITDINNNMDILDAAVNGIQDGLAIVANGNTHVAITAGQFVYVRNHGTLTEGLYVASTNIAANATLSTSNLTADSAGGLNALNSKIGTGTGWINATGQWYYRRKSGFVEVECRDYSATTDVPTSWTTIFTLPEGYRPSYRPAIFITVGSGNNQYVLMQILTGGEVQIVTQQSNVKLYGAYAVFGVDSI